MKFETPKNVNYTATVVALKDFIDLPNCDNVKSAIIFGNSIIVSKSAQVGELGLFFPVECQLSKEFLSNNNLYRKFEYGNSDPEKFGFFEAQGRVKAVKFRGNKSEGFFIPLYSLEFTKINLDEFVVGTVFDFVGDIEICRKYVPKHNPASLRTQQGKTAKLADSIVDGQFRFHYDTENLRRNIHKIQPEYVISLSDKWHGTSVVISNILVKNKLHWFEKILKKMGVKIQDSKFGYAYSSRRVIKSVDGIDKSNNIHFYDDDVWGVVAKEVEDLIPKGYSLYGEIVGFTPTSKPIQGKYHYGCGPMQHKFLVYRVTTTNADGKTLELSWPQMREFCIKYGLEMVKEIFYGKVTDLVPFDLYNDDVRDWQEKLLAYLEKTYVFDGLCPFNNNEVPAEGVVLRIDHLDECESYKLKNFAFLLKESKELDKGQIDIETEQSEGDN